MAGGVGLCTSSPRLNNRSVLQRLQKTEHVAPASQLLGEERNSSINSIRTRQGKLLPGARCEAQNQRQETQVVAGTQLERRDHRTHSTMSAPNSEVVEEVLCERLLNCTERTAHQRSAGG